MRTRRRLRSRVIVIDRASVLGELGEAVRTRRRTLNLSQCEAATLAGMSVNHWGEIERGIKEPRILSMTRIVLALDWPAEMAGELLATAIGDPVASPNTKRQATRTSARPA